MFSSFNDFCKKDRFFEKKYTFFKGKLNDLYDRAEAQTVRREYARGGECMHRGFYCPSPMLDIIIGGCKRGKLIKKPRKQADYEYFFDKDDRIIMAKQFCAYNIKIPPTIELIFYDLKTAVSALYQKNYPDTKADIQCLSSCVYENGLIKKYDFAEISPFTDKEKADLRNKINFSFAETSDNCDNQTIIKPLRRSFFCSEIKSESFEYDNGILKSSVLEFYNFDVNILSQEKYSYCYNSEGKILSYTCEEYENGEECSSCVYSVK